MNASTLFRTILAVGFITAAPVVFTTTAGAQTNETGCVVGSGTMESGGTKTTSAGTFITCNNGMVCNYRPNKKGGGSTEVCRWAPAASVQ